MTELADQGEKLNRIEDNLDVVNQDLKEADKAITSMDGGCLGGLFRQRNFQLKSKSPEKGGSKVSKLKKEWGCAVTQASMDQLNIKFACEDLLGGTFDFCSSQGHMTCIEVNHI